MIILSIAVHRTLLLFTWQWKAHIQNKQQQHLVGVETSNHTWNIEKKNPSEQKKERDPRTTD